MIERLVLLSIAHRAWVLGATFVFALLGLYSLAHLRFDALPDVTGAQVLVLTTAPGLTPEEVEQLVTRPLELATSGLPAQKGQRSISRYGLSAITLIFESDVDLIRCRQLVAERLAHIRDRLPEAADAPELGPITSGLGEVFQFVLASDRHTPEQLLELTETRIAPRLRSVAGIVEVNTWGGARRTLEITGDPIRMARREVTLSELANAARRSVGAAAGASLPAGESHVLLRGISLPTEPDDLAENLVGLDDQGNAVRIGDVAEVRFGREPRIGATTDRGRGEVVFVMAQMLTGENALDVLSRVHARLPEIRHALPEGVSLRVVYDRSELVGATLRTVSTSLLEGGALVVLVLLALLGSGRAGALVASVIPLSVLGGAIGMHALGIPGNLMSLGALDFGLLVDGAVVFVEALFHSESGEGAHTREPLESIASKVARPIFYSVSIILLVYVPVLALEGVEGAMFRPMALTVVMALSSSLLLTLTYVPALASLTLRPEHVPQRTPWLPRLFERAYGPMLQVSFRHRAVLISGCTGLLVFAGWIGSRLGTTFIPELDEGDLVVQTMRHADIGLGSAVIDATRLERAAAQIPEVRGATSRIGSPTVATDVMGIEQADVFVDLAPREEWRRGLTREGLRKEIENAIRTADPQVDLSFTQPIQMRFNELVGGAVTDVSVSIFGEDLAVLRHLAENYERALRTIPGAADVRIVAPPAVPVLEVRPQPLAAAQRGFDVADVLDIVRSARAGIDAGTTFEGPIRIPVRVRLGNIGTVFDAQRAEVPTFRGSIVSLRTLADVRVRDAPAMISHDEGARRIVIGFNVRGRDLGSVVAQAQRNVREQVDLPRGYRAEWGGQFESFERAWQRLSVVVPIVLALVLALLWAAFRSIRMALMVFLDVPFAAIGGVLALALRDMPLSISASVGFIALSGIAVLNGVVLVSSIREEERSGFTPPEAALRAARARLRPVLMTALVAGLGFVPMMMSEGVGAEVQRPLATVVIGGLWSSTVLTLLLLPTLYPTIARRRT